MSDHGYLLYARFKDDIFIETDQSIAPYYHALQWLVQSSTCVKSKLEACSARGVDMLDIHVYKGERFHQTCHLDRKPIWKSTSLGIPLAPSFGAPQGDPRVLAFSSDDAVGRQARGALAARLRQHGYPDTYLRLLDEWTPGPHRSQAQRARRPTRDVWFRVLYHRISAWAGIVQVCRVC